MICLAVFSCGTADQNYGCLLSLRIRNAGFLQCVEELANDKEGRCQVGGYRVIPLCKRHFRHRDVLIRPYTMINYEHLYNVLVEFVEQSFHIGLYAKVCLRIHKTRCAIEKLQIVITTVVMCHNPCPLVFYIITLAAPGCAI